jgi:transposase
MSWTNEQIEAMRAWGMDPACIPYAVEPIVQPAESTVREHTGDLTDAEFLVLMPFLPPEPRQAGAISNRTVLDALLWVQRTGKKLTQLPVRYGSPEAVRKRAERWAVAREWDQLLGRLDGLDLSLAKRESVRRVAEAQAFRGARIRKSRSAYR